MVSETRLTAKALPQDKENKRMLRRALQVAQCPTILSWAVKGLVPWP